MARMISGGKNYVNIVKMSQNLVCPWCDVLPHIECIWTLHNLVRLNACLEPIILSDVYNVIHTHRDSNQTICNQGTDWLRPYITSGGENLQSSKTMALPIVAAVIKEIKGYPVLLHEKAKSKRRQVKRISELECLFYSLIFKLSSSKVHMSIHKPCGCVMCTERCWLSCNYAGFVFDLPYHVINKNLTRRRLYTMMPWKPMDTVRKSNTNPARYPIDQIQEQTGRGISFGLIHPTAKVSRPISGVHFSV